MTGVSVFRSQITMASFTLHFFLLSIALFSVPCLSASLQPKPLILPIKKDPATNLFSATVGIGTPQHNLDLVIDLGAQILWYDCDNHYNSSSYRPVACGSKKCPANSPCVGCNSPIFKPGCSNDTCGANLYNPLANSIFSGDFGEDVLSISHTKVPRLLSGCKGSDVFDGDLLKGLPKGSKGIIGLARAQLTLPTLLALANKLPRKFALCLPSSNKRGFGNLFIGGGVPQHASKFLQTTPLIINPVSTAPIFTEGDPSDEYFIVVKSIKVDGKVVDFKSSLLSIDKKGNGGTKISTMDPHTLLHSSVFKPLVRDFVKKCSDRKIKRVAAVKPFEACFDLSTISITNTGLAVPTIDLELQGGLTWTIFGANSMVAVKKNVVCLGFLDGGKEPRTSVVIGGHQLEDNLLEFDLASSKLSFSSSLRLWKTRCSHL